MLFICQMLTKFISSFDLDIDDDDEDDDDEKFCRCIEALRILTEWHRLQNLGNGTITSH